MNAVPLTDAVPVGVSNSVSTDLLGVIFARNFPAFTWIFLTIPLCPPDTCLIKPPSAFSSPDISLELIVNEVSSSISRLVLSLKTRSAVESCIVMTESSS